MTRDSTETFFRVYSLQIRHLSRFIFSNDIFFQALLFQELEQLIIEQGHPDHIYVIIAHYQHWTKLDST